MISLTWLMLSIPVSWVSFYTLFTSEQSFCFFFCLFVFSFTGSSSSSYVIIWSDNLLCFLIFCLLQPHLPFYMTIFVFHFVNSFSLGLINYKFVRWSKVTFTLCLQGFTKLLIGISIYCRLRNWSMKSMRNKNEWGCWNNALSRTVKLPREIPQWLICSRYDIFDMQHYF